MQALVRASNGGPDKLTLVRAAWDPNLLARKLDTWQQVLAENPEGGEV